MQGTLHSNLVIFKSPPPDPDPPEAPSFTFQSGYIQIGFGNIVYNTIKNFTFQSGYIQIMSDLNRTCKFFTFTFQSGYIQIPQPNSCIIPRYTLHSNLVIFKYETS